MRGDTLGMADKPTLEDRAGNVPARRPPRPGRPARSPDEGHVTEQQIQRMYL